MDMVIVTCAAPEDAPATSSSTTKARRASIIAAIGAACPVSETGRMSGATLTLAGDAAEKVGAWNLLAWECFNQRSSTRVGQRSSTRIACTDPPPIL